MVDNSHATKVSFCIHQLEYLAATSRGGASLQKAPFKKSLFGILLFTLQGDVSRLQFLSVVTYFTF